MIQQPEAVRSRLRTLSVLLASFSLIAASLTASFGAKADRDRVTDLPDACAHLEVSAPNKVAFRTHAAGVQVYRWDGAAWVFQEPRAVLYAGDNGDGEVGLHYAGPTWESNSGSKVVGAVMERCTPDPDAIPWLKLRAVSAEGPGIFHRVAFIQRVNTTGGKAPADPGTFPGEIAEIPYTADYIFFR